MAAKKQPLATGICATCDFWKRKASPVKGKLIPGGTGKCTRAEGLCEDFKPKDPHPGWKGKPKKERGPSPQAPETTAPGSLKPGNQIGRLGSDKCSFAEIAVVGQVDQQQ